MLQSPFSYIIHKTNHGISLIGVFIQDSSFYNNTFPTWKQEENKLKKKSNAKKHVFSNSLFMSYSSDRCSDADAFPFHKAWLIWKY